MQRDLERRHQLEALEQTLQRDLEHLPLELSEPQQQRQIYVSSAASLQTIRDPNQFSRDSQIAYVKNFTSIPQKPST